MSNAMGYFTNPAPAAPKAPAYQSQPQQQVSTTPYYQGQAPIATADTWVPTAVPEPYTSGIRTASAGMAAQIGKQSAKVSAEWGKMLAMRGGRKTVAIKNAKSTADRASYLARVSKLSGNAAKRPGLLSALRGTFFSFGAVARAIGSSALVAIPMSLITNFMDWHNGRINEQQRNTLFVADSIGYTATGAVATLAAGATAATFLGGFMGTAVGLAAGLGLGWVYEKFIRPRWAEMVHSALYAAPAPQPVVPQPQPTPPPQPEIPIFAPV